MNYVDKGSKGFETLQNRKWVKLWDEVADYRSYKIKHPN